MNSRTYLDWNATTPLRPEARTAMAAALEVGNPSSVHGEGRAARRLVEQAREQVAAALGAEPRNVIFTSGGTEANALALGGGLERDGKPVGPAAVVSSIEHVSVPHAAPGAAQFGAGRDGVVSLDQLRSQLRKSSGCLVALMAANNETGVIQPVREAADLVHEAGGLLHVDAVQALGKMPLDINALGADLLAISGHKIGGPMGVGALVLASERLHVRSPLGGGQERNRRGGTENVVGIVGFGAAAVAAMHDMTVECERLLALRARLEQGLR